jgi:uncharacterized protein YegL
MVGDQVPFDFPDLVSNPEPRCPCLLLLDTSMSMRGVPLEQLNDGVRTFKEQLAADSMATQRVEIATVTFGPVRTISEFQTVDHFQPTKLTATGDTPIGGAVMHGLDMLETRKRDYRNAGISFYRPWVFLITDGGPTDAWQAAADRIHAGDNPESKAFSFFGVGVEGANMELLAKICSPTRPPLKLAGLNFRELFVWLSASLKGVSRSQVGTPVLLPPLGWASV